VEGLEERAVPASFIWQPQSGCGNNWAAVCAGGTTNWADGNGNNLRTSPGANGDGDLAIFKYVPGTPNVGSTAKCVVTSTPAMVVLQVNNSYNGGDTTSVIQLQANLTVEAVGAAHSFISAAGAAQNAIDLNPSTGVHGDLDIHDGGMTWSGTDIIGTAGESTGGKVIVHDKATLNISGDVNMAFGGVALNVGDDDYSGSGFTNWAVVNEGVANAGMKANVVLEGVEPSTNNKIWNTSSGQINFIAADDNNTYTGGGFMVQRGITTTAYGLYNNGGVTRNGTGMVTFDGYMTSQGESSTSPAGIAFLQGGMNFTGKNLGSTKAAVYNGSNSTLQFDYTGTTALSDAILEADSTTAAHGVLNQNIIWALSNEALGSDVIQGTLSDRYTTSQLIIGYNEGAGAANVSTFKITGNYEEDGTLSVNINGNSCDELMVGGNMTSVNGWTVNVANTLGTWAVNSKYTVMAVTGTVPSGKPAVTGPVGHSWFDDWLAGFGNLEVYAQ
jgi:hypothetical protein